MINTNWFCSFCFLLSSMKSKQPNKNAVFHCDDGDFDIIIVLLLFIQVVWIIKFKKDPPKKHPKKPQKTHTQ